MERWNTSVLAVEMREAQGFAFDFLANLPGNPSQAPRTSGLRVGFFTFPRYACGAHRTLVPHLIRTISTFLIPPRLSVNSFFSSSCGCLTLGFQGWVRSNVQSMFSAHLRHNLFL